MGLRWGVACIWDVSGVDRIIESTINSAFDACRMFVSSIAVSKVILCATVFSIVNGSLVGEGLVAG